MLRVRRGDRVRLDIGLDFFVVGTVARVHRTLLGRDVLVILDPGHEVDGCVTLVVEAGRLERIGDWVP